MDARLLIKKYRLDWNDLPIQNGLNICVIETVDSEEYDFKERGVTVKQWRHQLWLRGYRLPFRLNNTRVEILISMFGHDTDHWRGRKIGLLVGAVSSYGKTEMGILMHPTLVDHLEETAPPGHMLGTRQPAQGAMTPPPAPIAAGTPGNFDARRMGEKGADGFKQALAEQGTNYGEYLRWLRGRDASLFDRAVGVDIPDLPRGLIPSMRQYLLEYPSTAGAPSAPAGSLPSGQGRPPAAFRVPVAATPGADGGAPGAADPPPNATPNPTTTPAPAAGHTPITFIPGEQQPLTEDDIPF